MARTLTISYDIGTNSIGYSLYDKDDLEKALKGVGGGESFRILGGGVVIFSDSRNQKNKTSLAVHRRVKRSTRRQISRRSNRSRRLWRLISSIGLVGDITINEKLKDLDPYSLRAKALDEVLSANELARSLMHLAKHRGYKSTRKHVKKKKDDDQTKVLDAIAKTKDLFENSGHRTIGEYLNDLHQDGAATRNSHSEYRIFFTREQVIEEFNHIRKSQGNSLISEKDWDTIYDIIFFQRPITSPRPGKCSIYPDKLRFPRSSYLFCEFALANDIANLKIIRGKKDFVDIPLETKKKLFEEMKTKKSKSFNALAKQLGLSSGESLNLATEKNTALKGHRINPAFYKDEDIREYWDEISDEKKEQIIAILLKEETEQEVLSNLLETGIKEDLGNKFLDLDLSGIPNGYCSYSKEALEVLTREAKETFDPIQKVLKRLDWIRKTENKEKLEYYAKQIPHLGYSFSQGSVGDEAVYGKIGNPTVHVALNMVQRLTNQLITKYGNKYSNFEFFIELARDLKHPAKIKLQILKSQNENEKKNKRIAERLNILNQQDNRLNRHRYSLWEDQEGICIYSGKPIPEEKIFGGETDVDHIIPISRSLDDSYRNKVLCYKKFNSEKLKLTPFEAFGGDASNYSKMLERASILSRDKQKRFSDDPDIAQHFLQRQLTDTAYITKIAAQYLRAIGPVKTINGPLIGNIRYQWGLNRILGPDNTKNRNDHRHHFIDACLLPFSTDKMTKFVDSESINRLRLRCPIGQDNLYEEITRHIEKMVTFHKPDHGINKGIFDDTLYGPPSFSEDDKDKNTSKSRTLRIGYGIDQNKITESNLAAIVDPYLRNSLQEEYRKGKRDSVHAYLKKYGITSIKTEVVVSTIPITRTDRAGRQHVYYLKSAENYSIDIWRMRSSCALRPPMTEDPYIYQPRIKKGAKYQYVFRGNRIIDAIGQQDLRPHPAAKKLMSIRKGDYLAIRENEEEAWQIYLVQALKPTNKNIILKKPSDLKPEKKNITSLSYGAFLKKDIRKAHVDILGQVQIGDSQFR